MRDLWKEDIVHKKYKTTKYLPQKLIILTTSFISNLVETIFNDKHRNLIATIQLLPDNHIQFEWQYKIDEKSDTSYRSKYTNQHLKSLKLDTFFDSMIDDDFISGYEFIYPLLEIIREKENVDYIRIVGTPSQISKIYI